MVLNQIQLASVYELLDAGKKPVAIAKELGLSLDDVVAAWRTWKTTN